MSAEGLKKETGRLEFLQDIYWRIKIQTAEPERPGSIPWLCHKLLVCP